jgi:hypothetical protein
MANPPPVVDEESEAEKTCKRLKCDPVAILALFAKGDVVGLGLMTAEEFKDPGKIDQRTKQWIRTPGRLKALDLIPAEERQKAAKELAPYFRPKKAPTPAPVPPKPVVVPAPTPPAVIPKEKPAPPPPQKIVVRVEQPPPPPPPPPPSRVVLYLPNNKRDLKRPKT